MPDDVKPLETEQVDSTPAAAEAPAPAKEPGSIREALQQGFDKSNEAPTVSGEPTNKAPEAKPGDKPVEAQKPDQVVDPNKAPRLDRIPPGWKGGAAAWHALDANAKAYIVESNAHASKKIEQQAHAAQFAQTVAAEFAPYEAMLRAEGANPQSAVRFLLGEYYTLRAGTPQQRAQKVYEIAQAAGVDLRQLAEGAPAPVDPTIAELQRQVATLGQQLTQQRGTQQSSEQQEINAKIDAFAADPKHEHFESVKQHMAALLMTGACQDLESAYETACWANPDTRSSFVNKSLTQDAEKRRQQAIAAQNANVQVTGAPPAPVTDASDLSIRGLLQSGFAQAGGRV